MAELVGLNSEVPDILPKLSQLLSIQHQRTQLGMEQQTARQRSALADYDFNKHIGDDGTVDLNSLMNPELRAAAGDQYLDVLQHAAAAKQGQLAAKQTLVNLRGTQRDAFGEMMNALRSDQDVAEDTEKGRQKVNEAMLQFGEMYGEDALPVLRAYAAPLQKAPKGKLGDALRAIGLQSLDASKQIETQKPQYASTGGELTDINPNTAPGAAPSSIPLTLSPGMQILTDQAGAQFAFNPQTNQVTPVGQGRGGAPAAQPIAGPAPSAPPGQPFQQPTYPGQAHDIQVQQQEVQNIRATADRAPLNRNIYKHVLTLADDTTTGQLAGWAQKNPIIGQMFGDNYQELGKYLEKNAIENMTAMGGPPSDARLTAATAANGSTHFNAKALKAVTQFNYATNTGLEKYRQGIDKAIGTENPKYGQLPAFKAEWAKNFDVDVFRLENAIADGDTKTKNEILNGLDKSQAASLMKKMKNLDSLAATGKVTQ